MLPGAYEHIHAITTSGVTQQNGAIKHILHESVRGYRCSLFILSLHALALHLAVKILLQIFLYEDLSTLCHIHLWFVFPPECQRTLALFTQPILLIKHF